MLKIIENKKYSSLLENINNLFDQMDLEYQIVSEKYGFKCYSCKDNCCLTLFYHHTLIEYLYVNKGFNDLPEKQRRAIKKKAILNNKKLENNPILHIMCPLNIKNRCIIYKYRPMICRLHGIPHQLNYSTTNINFGPGCHNFESLKLKSNVKRLDRTYYYKELASLELKAREIIGFNKRIKMTISEIITKGFL